MKAAGIENINQLSKKMRQAGFKATTNALGLLVNMKTLPETKKLEWRSYVKDLADFLQCLPEDLFSERQRTTALRTNVIEAECHFAQLEQLLTAPSPEVALEREEFLSALAAAMLALPARTHRVLTMRFGLDGQEPKEVTEVARLIGVSAVRIQQLQNNGLRQLRILDSSRKHEGELRLFLDSINDNE